MALRTVLRDAIRQRLATAMVAVLALLLVLVAACAADSAPNVDGEGGSGDPASSGGSGEAALAPKTGRVVIGGETLEIALFVCLTDAGAFRGEGTWERTNSVEFGLQKSEFDREAPYIEIRGDPGWISGTIASERGAQGAEITDIAVRGGIGTGKAVFAQDEDFTLEEGSFEFNCN